MRKLIVVIVMLAMILSSFSFADTDSKGSLVIVGGALRADTDEVYEAFIKLAGGKENAKIGIVPAASGSPYKYSQMFIDDMTSRGVAEENIVVLELAVKNDKRSEDVDESLWSDNGNNPDVATKVNGLTGIWFVGGDQMRVTDVLLNEDGTNTLVLDEIWKVYNKGGVIGGTSAGAAIMSEIMIAGGDSFGALTFGHTEEFDSSTLDYQNQGGLVVDDGLGFFKEGIIDQHFDRKARLGRLIVVSYENKDEYPVSYGVEENTALIYHASTNMIEVAGTGGVVVVDVRDATKNASNDYSGISVSYLESVDKYDISNDKFLMDDEKYTTLGYEYMYTENPVMGGAVSPNQTFKTLIAYNLVDNEAASEINTYLFNNEGVGYEFKFYNKEETEGYWDQSGAADLYSFENVGLDIRNINMKVTAKTSSAYTVKAGDMLWKIAKNNGVTINDLMTANNIANPNLLQVGQVIMIP